MKLFSGNADNNKTNQARSKKEMQTCPHRRVHATVVPQFIEAKITTLQILEIMDIMSKS